MNISFRKIKYIFLDLDDTLCDFQEAKTRAFKFIDTHLENKGIDTMEFRSIHSDINPKLLRRFLDGAISKEEFRARRFGDVLEKMGSPSEPLANDLSEIYMREGNQTRLFDDVVPFLNFIKNKFDAALLTNGPSDGQRKKILGVSLDKYIEKIYISEDVGFAKPSPEYFSYVLDDLGIKSSQAVMVGDSIKNDCEGAALSGISCFLLDRYNKHDDYKGLRLESLDGLIDIIRNDISDK